MNTQNGTENNNDGKIAYISRYHGQRSPGYAVLVTGEWGTGKTYQVKRTIPENEYYYVSLFDLSDTKSVHNAILSSWIKDKSKHAIPDTKKTFSQLISSITEIFGKKYQIIGDIATAATNAILHNTLISSNRTLIFDDLERCPLRKDIILGAINYYVEHLKLKVIVICNDKKLLNDESFESSREKIFGHVIHVTPKTNSALQEFTNEISDNKSKSIIKNNIDIIEQAWNHSTQQSLRVLQRVIKDLEELVSKLNEDHKSNIHAIREILYVFSSIAIETRIGNINDHDLLNREAWRYAIHANTRNINIEAVHPILEKYILFDICSQTLNDKIIKNMLIDGLFDQENINRSISESVFFYKINYETIEPWKIIIKFDETDDEILRKAIERMEDQFNRRSVINPGEFLHICALRLLMVETGEITTRSLEEETSLCIEYINDLCTNNILPFEGPYILNDHISARDSYDGHGYWHTEKSKPYFEKIRKYIMEKQENLKTENYVNIGKSVIRDLENNTSIAIETMTTIYGDSPIFKKTSPSVFLASWIKSPRERWLDIMHAIEIRYCYGNIPYSLHEEEKWLKELHNEIVKVANNECGLKKLRIERIIPRFLKSQNNGQ